MLRTALRRSALPLMPRQQVPALLQSRFASIEAADSSGRTPERTAELERLAEEHNGFLFGEVPRTDGKSREWEDWEYSYVPLMSSAFLIYGVWFWNRPVKGGLNEWARDEAVKRMEEE
eukprot:CAMPEP_0174723226 /NCGR_PEP_ID=MMETSP1094-20130205/40408_1 /TAXON_ID=156173 /ORGANISM="Chrysochromulina brevifilum, Strain UTEX LB 985" /LENGTH=117 /DNA_ID=CAMNT_0015924235 /DNA_START=19 /DNA_END=372 /DNA_ORIENTATION=+